MTSRFRDSSLRRHLAEAGRPDTWWHEPQEHHEYSREDELLDQLEKLPSPQDVGELLSVLRVVTLRAMSIDITNGAIAHLKGGRPH